MRDPAEGILKRASSADVADTSARSSPSSRSQSSTSRSSQSQQPARHEIFVDENAMQIFAFSRPKKGGHHNGDDYFVEKCGDSVIIALMRWDTARKRKRRAELRLNS